MFETKRTVYGSHCGVDRKMKLSEIMGFLNDCEQYQLDYDKAAADFFKSMQAGVYVIYRQADFLRYPDYNEKLSVTTHIYEMNAVAGFRNTKIEDENGNVCAISYAMGVFVDINTQRIARFDPQNWEGYNYDKKLDMEYTDRKIILPKELNFKESAALNVPRDYIDFYNHVNNAKYLSFAVELLPDDFIVKRLRIEYKKAAQKGDVIKAKKALYSNGDYYIILEDETKTPYCIMQFIPK